MTNSIEINPCQPMLNLVQKNVSPEVRSLEKIRSLPHLQRVATLVFLLIETKSRFWEKSNIEILEKTQKETERLEQQGVSPKTKDSKGAYGFSILELDANSDWLGLYFSLDKRNREDLPKIIAEKIEEYGDPFGFGQQVTRSILEMADDSFENQISDIADDADSEWNPNPIDYLENVMIDMFGNPRFSGGSPFLNTKLQAEMHMRYEKIFPKDVAEQMRDYIKQM